jgi:alginate O-acetyltransferase complex protein AlgI
MSFSPPVVAFVAVPKGLLASTMNLTSLLFLAFAFVAVILLRLAPSGVLRRLTIFGLNAAFLVSMVKAPLQLVPLVGFVLLGYGAILVAGHARSSFSLGTLVTGLVAIFIWLKRYPIVSAIPTFSFVFTVVGLSYILFRILHVLIDVAQGSLRRPSFIAYLNYIFFFLNLLSGPIQRYEDFEPQAEMTPPPLGWEKVNASCKRVVLGYLMVMVIGNATINFVDMVKPPFFDALSHGKTVFGIYLFALLTFAYLINLFVNFAGYMNIVIGIGGLAGIVLPENFDHPFLSESFLDLWSRWHITLSNWFKTYLFNPLLRILSARWGTRNSTPYLGAIGLYVTFFVMAVWHGTTWIFVIYGLFLGSGAAVNRLWQILIPKFFGKNKYKMLSGHRWYFQFSRAATISYLAVALTSFWINGEQARELGRPSGLAILFGSLTLMTVVGAVLGHLWGITSPYVRDFLGSDHLPSVNQTTTLPVRSGALRTIAIPILALTLASAGATAVALFATRSLEGHSLPYSVVTLALFTVTLAATCVAAGVLDSPVSHYLSSLAPQRHADAAALWLGVRGFMVVSLAAVLSSAPAFIYQAF